MITARQIVQIMPYCTVADRYEGPINDAMVAFAIDQTWARQAAFLAQVAHETGELRYVQEIASGNAYEGRADLGNTQAGDGARFRGRGLLQITGRRNYADCSLALYGDSRLLDTPALLIQPPDGANAAGWFWQCHDLNNAADSGEFEHITRTINGGTNGQVSRLAYWAKAKQTLGLT